MKFSNRCVKGIRALGPGESRKIDWGQFGGLKAATGDSKIVAKCLFKKNGREMPPIICPLDVDSFSGTVAAESPASKTAKEIEEISKTLERLPCPRRFCTTLSDSRESHIRTHDDHQVYQYAGDNPRRPKAAGQAPEG